MSTQKNLNTETKLNRTLLWTQVFFWMAFFIFYWLLEGRFIGYGDSFIDNIIGTVYLLILTYGNALYFFPKYAGSKKYFTYAVIIIAFLLAMVYLRTIAEDRFVHHYRRVMKINLFEPLRLFNKFFLGLITLLLSSLLRFSIDFINLRNKYNEVENYRLKSEIKYLRLKLNPHFLFNTLNNIY